MLHCGFIGIPLETVNIPIGLITNCFPPGLSGFCEKRTINSSEHWSTCREPACQLLLGEWAGAGAVGAANTWRGDLQKTEVRGSNWKWRHIRLLAGLFSAWKAVLLLVQSKSRGSCWHPVPLKTHTHKKKTKCGKLICHEMILVKRRKRILDSNYKKQWYPQTRLQN